MTTNIQSPTLTAKQAAQYIGVSYWTLLSLVRQGLLNHPRLKARVVEERLKPPKDVGEVNR